jgi:arsenite methyltransferase
LRCPGATVVGVSSDLDALLAEGDLKACCAAVYEHPAVRWLLGGELHPGGEATTRRALELIGVAAGDRLLDVASGTGASALLAARELGCSAVGVEYGALAVDAANAAARAEALDRAVEFRRGDAEDLPFGNDEFDAVLCECSLCLFTDKRRAIEEIRRVLRPGGRLALSDVVVDRRRLPPELDGAIAAIACVGEALSRQGYERLLAEAGLQLTAIEARADDAAALARRVEDRLRGARVLGLDRIEGSPVAIGEAIDLAGVAHRAIADGSLGYAIFAATSP